MERISFIWDSVISRINHQREVARITKKYTDQIDNAQTTGDIFAIEANYWREMAEAFALSMKSYPRLFRENFLEKLTIWADKDLERFEETGDMKARLSANLYQRYALVLRSQLNQPE